MTKLIKDIRDIKSIIKGSIRPVGFIPTMGALHAGHISLIQASKAECKTTVTSIFVNPLQFGPDEDFEKYPRDLKNDLKICEKNNVDYVFAPSEEEICSDLKNNIITTPDELSTILCGKTRKNHFNGVATIVKKLFEVVEPDYGYFGEKDLQQLYIMKWLVKEFKLPVFPRACPIVREPSGLACSSRNKYLTEEQKLIAPDLYKSLKIAKQNTRSGIFTVSKSILESLVFLSQFNQIKVEYFEARSKETLEVVPDNVTKGFYYLLAARVGNVRLIDNIEV